MDLAKNTLVHTIPAAALATVVLKFATPGVAVKPGEPASVPVKLGVLPANARVSRITASLQVHGSGPGPAQETQVKVTEGSAAAKTFGIEFNLPAGLQNVQLKLDDGDVFWNRPGPVAPGLYQVPDFSAQVNAYLARVKPAGETTLPFVVTSETAGNVEIELSAQFALVQDQSWTNALDGSTHADKKVPLQINQVVALSLDPVTVPGGRTLKRVAVTLDASGEFGPDRVLGPLESHDGAEFATVSPDYSVAQRLTLRSEIVAGGVQCSGVGAYLKADAPRAGETLELYVELQGEQNGAPASGDPLAKATVPFTPADSGDQPWTVAMFEAPAELKTDVPYWAVVKGVRGRTRIGLSRADDSTNSPIARSVVATHRGGQTWRFLGARASADRAPHALLAPLHVPGPENTTAAIELSVSGGGEPRRIDPGAEAANVVLPLAGESTSQVSVVVRSAAVGTLTVANVQQKYELA